MQYTTHYNLNLPEGTDIVNPLIQDNPNYSAIDTALYDNKLRVIGNATHTKTGTNHSIVLADSDIVAFKFVATGDYATGDTFTVDGVTVTVRVADGSTIPNGAFKINSTVEAIIDGTILNLINVKGTNAAANISYDNTSSGLTATNLQNAIDELADRPHITYTTTDTSHTWGDLLDYLFNNADRTKLSDRTVLAISDGSFHRISQITSNALYFDSTHVYASAPYWYGYRFVAKTSGSSFSEFASATYTDRTNETLPSGFSMSIYY